MSPIITASDTIARGILPQDIQTQLERPLPEGQDTCTYYQKDFSFDDHLYHLFATFSSRQATPEENGYFLALLPAASMTWEAFQTDFVHPFLARGKNLVHAHLDHHHPPSS
jgi:hypothetical protein